MALKPRALLINLDNLETLRCGSPLKAEVIEGFGKGRILKPDLDIRDFALRGIKADQRPHITDSRPLAAGITISDHRP